MTRTRLLMLPTAMLVLALAGSATVVGQRAATTPEALMGAAQHQEDVEGNIDAAIATYRKVADNPKAPRALAASALLQIGRLHEKRGSREATRAYERIAKEFADQPTIVAQARSRLTAMGTAPAETGQVVARQVWAGEGVDAGGSISSDGRLYAFVDWTSTATGNLAVRDLATGDIRRLTSATTMAEGYADFPTWSADGKRLAYVWGEKVVRIVNSDGTGSRDVFTRHDTYPAGLRWSPDGRTLAMALSTNRTELMNELALLSVETGAIMRSRPAGTRELSLGTFSPDGRHVVFGLASRSTADDGGIHLLEVASGQDTPVVEGPGRYARPAWSPDNRTIVFVSDRSGSVGLWAVAVENRSHGGQPRLLRPNTGNLASLDFSRDGTLWYGVRQQTTDVYVCDVDPVRLAPISTPVRLTERLVGASSGSAWSPDGSHIVYLRGPDRSKRTVVVRSTATGAERELPAPVTNTENASTYGPTWLPDGQGVLVTDVDYSTSRMTVHHLSLDSTPPRIDLKGDLNTTWPHLRVSPDGRAFYLSRRDPTPSAGRGTLLLVRRDRASGEETVLYRAPSLGAAGFFGLAVSPDGHHLAFSQNTGPNERALVVVPAAGGEPRVILRGNYRMPQVWTGVWTPDGRHVVVTGRQNVSPGAPNDLWAVPVDGGPPKALGLSRRGGLSAASFSPDGKRLAFTGGDSSSELWSLTNVLGTAKPAAR